MAALGKQSLSAARAWYARNEHRISVISFFGGFAVDALTLTRADKIGENIFAGVRLAVVAACIVLIARKERAAREAGGAAGDNPERDHFVLVTVMQFIFGSLLSTFLIFYFRSAALAVSWPFFLIVGAAAVANETHKRHYSRIGFQTGFFFLSVYLFAAYAMPLIMNEVGRKTFIAAGVASLGIMLLFFAGIKRLAGTQPPRSRRAALGAVIAVTLVMNGFYFLGIIPPLPLLLQDAGIYHSVSRTADGHYAVTEEPATLFRRALTLINSYPPYHADTDTAYAYTAVFSPGSFRTVITHEWQQYDESARHWETRARIPLAVTGGRDGGFRTYSLYGRLQEGKWRVNVLAPGGETIGRMSFKVTKSIPPSMRETVKD